MIRSRGKKFFSLSDNDPLIKGGITIKVTPTQLKSDKEENPFFKLNLTILQLTHFRKNPTLIQLCSIIERVVKGRLARLLSRVFNLSGQFILVGDIFKLHLTNTKQLKPLL